MASSQILRRTATTSPPWLMLPPSYSMYSLPQGKVVNRKQESHDETEVVGSSHGWLALFNHRHRNLSLWNPITHQNVDLPPLDQNSSGNVSKVIVSCPVDEDKWFAVMSFASGRKLAYCRPGLTTEWTPFGGCSYDHVNGLTRVYPDFVYSSRHKQFFCLAQFEGVEGLDLEMHHLHREPLHFRYNVGGGPNLHDTHKLNHQTHLCRYLVCAAAEQSDQLFLVTRLLGDALETVGFHVHRVDRPIKTIGNKTLCYKEDSLDGLVMFVGLNHSVAVAAAEHPELRPDSIYFSGDDVGIFDYRNKTVSPCYYPSEVQRVHPVAAPFWFTPTLHTTT